MSVDVPVGSTGPSFDQAVLRQAFGCFPSGVTALCGMVGNAPHGMAASSFTSVSLEPPFVSVCVAHTSATWPVLSKLPRLGVSVLAEDHAAVVTSLAAKNTDRFDGVVWESSSAGAVFVHGSTLWLECSVETQLPAGDHDIVLLRIQALHTYPDVSPMVFHGSRYRQLTPFT
jgi:flavin reductase (DIM6/NTAB) family NADH-FMN oxidoreductase RutF